MRVEDLMTRDVVSVAPSTSVKSIAETLVEHRISGLPVCEMDGTVVGVVSEGDILVRAEGRAEASRGVLGWLIDGPSAVELVKARALTADQAMTAPAITIAPHRPAAAAARTMVERGVNRLIVVDGYGKLVGIVTRADIVRAFARPDDEIEQEIRQDVLLRMIWAEPGRVDVSVRNGEVELRGELETTSDVELLEAFVGRVTGVLSVDCRVRPRFDDAKRRPRFASTG
jgi:CBS domain-containing protein